MRTVTDTAGTGGTPGLDAIVARAGVSDCTGTAHCDLANSSPVLRDMGTVNPPDFDFDAACASVTNQISNPPGHLNVLAFSGIDLNSSHT